MSDCKIEVQKKFVKFSLSNNERGENNAKLDVGISDFIYPIIDRDFQIKTGLLNHYSLMKTQGICFRKCRLFHTVSMKFPICFICLNKKSEYLFSISSVPPDVLIIFPRSVFYVVEVYPNLDKEIFGKNILRCSNVTMITGNFIKLLFELMFFIKLIFFIVFISFFTFCIFAKSIPISLNEKIELPLPRSPESIEIKNPSILSIQRSNHKNSLEVVGKNKGISDIIVRYEGYSKDVFSIRVGIPDVEQEAFSSLIRLSDKVNKINGLHSAIENGKVSCFGKIDSFNEYRKFVSIVPLFPDMFISSFQFDNSLLNKIVRSINEDLKSMNDLGLKVFTKGELFFLSGFVKDEESSVKTKSYLNAVLPGLIDTTTKKSSGDPRVVQIQLQLMEVARYERLERGTNLSNVINSTPISLSTSSTQFNLVPLSFYARLLENRGYVKELAKPVIVARSGETAQFLSGGEVPVVTYDRKTKHVEFKPFGISFKATPKVQDDLSIWLQLEVELSSVSNKNSYDQVPGFATRKISTHVVLRDGYTAFLTGLAYSKELSDQSGLPSFLRFSFLKFLFSMQDEKKEDSELWISVSASPEKSLLPSFEENKVEKKDSFKTIFDD